MVCYITSKLTYWMMPNASLVRLRCVSAQQTKKRNKINTRGGRGEGWGVKIHIFIHMTNTNATLHFIMASGISRYKMAEMKCMKYEDSNIPYHLLIGHPIFHGNGNIT